MRRKKIPLETVQQDLKEYSFGLDQELLDLINKDYTDFINLSSNLFGIEKLLALLRSPLQQSQKEVSTCNALLTNWVSTLQNKLEEQRSLQEKRNILLLFVNISDSITKIERLLQITSLETPSLAILTFSSNEESSNLIERVATEFNQLRYYVEKGKNLHFVIKQENRIRTIEGILSNGLEKLFREGISSNNQDQIANCLRTFDAIDKCKVAHNIFRSTVVKPWIDQVVFFGAV